MLAQRRLPGTVTLTRVSPDARTVAAVLRDRVELRAAPDLAHRAVVRVTAAPAPVSSLAFAPDSKQWAVYHSAGGGSLVVARDDGRVVFRKRLAPGVERKGGSVAYARRQIILSRDGMGTLVFDDQGRVLVPRWLERGLRGEDVNTDGSRIAFWGGGAATIIWDVDRDQELARLTTPHPRREHQWVGPYYSTLTDRGFVLVDPEHLGHQEPLGELSLGDRCAFAPGSGVVRCAGSGRLWWRKLGDDRDTNVLEPPPYDVLAGPAGLIAESRAGRTLLRRRPPHDEVLAEAPGRTLAFSPRGVLFLSQAVAAQPSPQSRLVTLDATGRVVTSTSVAGDLVRSVFDEQGTRALTVSGQTLYVSDAHTLALLQQMKLPSVDCSSVAGCFLAWRAGANEVVVSDDEGRVVMLDLERGEPRRELRTGVPRPRVRASPDGSVVVVLPFRGSGVLWSEHGLSPLTLERDVHDLCFSPDSKRLSLVDDEVLTEVELTDGRAGTIRERRFRAPGARMRHEPRFMPASPGFSPEGAIYLRGDEGQLLWLNPTSWQMSAEPAVSRARRVELVDWRGSRVRVGLPALFAEGHDRLIEIDLASARVVRQSLRPIPRLVRDDGKVEAGDDWVLDLETGRMRGSPRGRVTAWSERLELGLGTDGVTVTTPATGSTRSLRVPELRHATFAADDDWLILVASSGRVSTLDWRTGKAGPELERDGGPVASSRDRRTLAILGRQGRELSLYDTSGFELLRREALPAPGALVAVSSDGERVAVADSDARITVWSRAGPPRRYALRPDVAVADLMFDSSGQHLLIGGNLLRFLRLRDGHVLSAWVADIDHGDVAEPGVLWADGHGNLFGDRRILSTAALQVVRQGHPVPFDIDGAHHRTDLWSWFLLGRDDPPLARPEAARPAMRRRVSAWAVGSAARRQGHPGPR